MHLYKISSQPHETCTNLNFSELISQSYVCQGFCLWCLKDKTDKSK